MSAEAIHPGQVWQTEQDYYASQNLIVVERVQGHLVTGRLLVTDDGRVRGSRLHRLTSARLRSRYQLVSEVEQPLPVSLEEERRIVCALPEGDLCLDYRGTTAVRELGAETIGDVTNLTAEALLAQHNFGEMGLRDLRQRLAALGLSLRGEGA